jgi:hypothetical protein
MIIRSPRPKEFFYTVNKKISEDKRLSWAARGMLIFLLGKPDTWTVSVANLINETKESGAPLGRDGVRRVMKQLIAAGYMWREGQLRAEGGKLSEANYLVCEEAPKGVQPIAPGALGTCSRLTAKPLTVKRPLVSNEVKQVLTKAKNDRNSASAKTSISDATASFW